MKAQKRMFYLIGVIAMLLTSPWVLASGGPFARTASAQAGLTAGTWVTETVQASGVITGMGGRSLALDLYGRPHVAFGGDHLYYASYTDGQWQTEIVDPDNQVGRYASLALDTNGYPHIAYFDANNEDLKYAHYDGAAWRIERVDGDGDSVGWGCSLALGTADRPQISYLDRLGQTLKLAWYDGTSWNTAVLDSAAASFSTTALAMDAAGYPHIAYRSAGLKYAYVTADNVWHLEVADSTIAIGESIALSLDNQGQPHLLYTWLNPRGSGADVRYAYYDGSQWQKESVASSSYIAEANSLALDPAGQPHLTYHDWTGDALYYAYHDGHTWQIDTIDSSGSYSSLALDPSGHPHVSYYSPAESALKYAHVVPPTFADPALEAVWQRTDRPVAEGVVARSWMWGPLPITSAAFEPYADSPGGSRLVQYFDKSRMEINDPNGDRSSPWFVTNGLLVREMVSGWLQLGDNQFENWGSSDQAVAGDPAPNNPNCPVYATFTGLIDVPAGDRSGQPVTATLARDGTLGDDPTKAGYPGTAIAHYEATTGHNVPQALWAFMNQRGPIYVGGRYKNGTVVDWLFAMGYPISEPYWTRCTVAGQEKDVLVQLFERRVLTYTPSNPAGWQVEMGNVGRHYYTWRYGVEP